MDRYKPLHSKLVKEIAGLKQLLESEAIKVLSDPKYLPHGNPLEEGPLSRYTAWPARRGEMPLLYFCSTIILAASCAANDNVERFNSSAGYIYSKLRNCLAPAKVEQLTVARAHLQAVAKELAKDKTFEELDLEDLLAEAAAAKEEKEAAKAAVAAAEVVAAEGEEEEEDSD